MLLERGMSKLYLKTNRNTTINYMQVMLMKLMSKIEYFIVPKGTKFMRSDKLGLSCLHLAPILEF